MNRLTKLLAGAVLALGTMATQTTVTSAGDCYSNCRYEWVLAYQTRQVPYKVCETRYDHCGRPYHVEVTRYRTETVPVWQRQAVCY